MMSRRQKLLLVALLSVAVLAIPLGGYVAFGFDGFAAGLGAVALAFIALLVGNTAFGGRR